MHLNLLLSKKLAAVVKIETEKEWHFRKGVTMPNSSNDWYIADKFLFADKTVPCPRLLSEWGEVFQKLGEEKNWGRVCKECGSKSYDANRGTIIYTLLACECDTDHIPEYLYHYLRFCQLAATDWVAAESYIESLI